MGRWSNHAEQQERIQALLQMVPSGSSVPVNQTSKRVHRQLRPQEVSELVAAYQAGATVYELAEQFRVHRGTVSRLLEREGVPRRHGPLSSAQVEQALGLYRTGQSAAAVAAQVGCNPNTLRRALVKAGVRIRDNRGREHR